MKSRMHAGPGLSAPNADSPVLADGAASGLQPFGPLTQASVEALRYRGEDIARSITKAVVKEVSLLTQLVINGIQIQGEHLVCSSLAFVLKHQ